MSSILCGWCGRRYVVRRGLLKSSGAAAVLPPTVLRMPRSDRGEVCWLPRAAPKPEPVRSTDSCTLGYPQVILQHGFHKMSSMGSSNFLAMLASQRGYLL